MTSTSRQRKTPRQRAEAALAVSERRVERLQAQHTKLHAEAEQVAADLDEAERRRDYLNRDPALEDEDTLTTTTGDTTP